MEQYNRYDRGGLLKDRYLKVADISEGSYGLVSLAKDTKLSDKLVAVKFIFPIDYKRTKQLKELSKTGRATSSPAKLRSNAAAPESQHSESSTLKALYEETNKEIRIHQILGAHDNITNLVDYFDSYLVLEYCSRGDLYETVQNGLGPSTSQDIKDVFSQILDALAFCHTNSVYHRDLKPENILIDQDWSIKICDWGLATTQRIITNKAEFDIGSERYMAPELFDTEQESYDAAKVDLWSVGVILLTLVFHKNPFQVANYTDKRFLQFSANREALFDFFSSMTGEMFSTLRYCLNIDPSNRDLDSLKHELDNLNYFTIDEEYWAEHSDDDENGYEDYYEEHATPVQEQENEEVDESPMESDDEMFKFDNEVKEMSPPQALVMSPKVAEAPHVIIDEDHKLLESASESSTATESMQRDDSMPYNRRADALLSPAMGARPIPIGAGQRLIRNTRKPFGVASYNKNAFSARHGFSHQGTSNSFHTGSFGARFRREDFFTPRSVVNHYMDKYGEQRELERSEKDKKRRWKRGRKKQSWKRAVGHDYRNSDHRNGHNNQSGSKRHTYTSGHSHNDTATRRKHVNGKRRPRPDSMQSPQLQPQGGGRANGKYVPPNLRSPSSKAVDHLVDDLDGFRLNEDPVFHLEGDLKSIGIGRSTGSEVRGNATSHNSKVPTFNSAYTQHSDSNGVMTSKTQLEANGKGKYIPPFRRGSHTGAVHLGNLKATNVLNSHQAPNTSNLGADDIASKRRSYQLGAGSGYANYFNNENVPRSAPGHNWIEENKNWSDFD